MAPLRIRLSVVALLISSAPLAAQLPAITVPRGHARVDLGGAFSWWDQAFIAGVKQPAISSFLRNPIDAAWLPGLGESEAALRAVTGSQALNLSPGQSTGSLAINRGLAELGLAFGITSRITLFGSVPIVRVRVLEQLLIDSTGATAGFNPASPLFGTSEGAATTNAFLSELGTVLSMLNAAIQAGRFDQDPALREEALATLSRGTALRAGLETLLLGSDFLPLAGTPGALALNQTIDSLRLRLATLDPASAAQLTRSPALPEAGLVPADLEAYATQSGGRLQLKPFQPEIYTALGDVEVGAAFALLQGTPPRSGWSIRSVLRGSIRLPTAQLTDPNGLFEAATGDRQVAMRGDLITDIMGSRFGARIGAGYLRYQKATLQRRVTPPDQPLAPITSLAMVERQPGDLLEGSFQPYLRIARNFSVTAGITHWRRQGDRYNYAPGQESPPAIDPNLLAQGSKANATAASAGLSFSHSGLRRDGRVGLPLDATVSGRMVVGSSEGRVEAQRSIVFQMRLYAKLF